jgi:hypothetical protein
LKTAFAPRSQTAWQERIKQLHRRRIQIVPVKHALRDGLKLLLAMARFAILVKKVNFRSLKEQQAAPIAASDTTRTSRRKQRVTPVPSVSLWGVQGRIFARTVLLAPIRLPPVLRDVWNAIIIALLVSIILVVA